MGDVAKLDNKMSLFFENTKKDIIMTKKIRKVLIIIIYVDHVKKKIEADSITDHCHFTGKSRVPAHQPCNINVTQKQSPFIPFVFRNFSIFDCHLFHKKLVDEKNVDVKFDIVLKTDQE